MGEVFIDYSELPPEGKADLGDTLADILKRAGEQALLDFARIGAQLREVKEQYGCEPSPDDPQPKSGEEGAAAFLDVATMFIDALEEDSEIQAYKGKKTILELIDSGILHAAMIRTVQRLQAQRPADKPAQKLPSIAGKRIRDVGFPIDKVNANIWKLLERDMGGQIAIAAESSKSKKQLNIYYSINFDSLGADVVITRQLEPFDKRVYIAIGALWAAGQQIMSLGQIYDAMGYVGEPGSADYQRISASITKMMGAHIYLNNTEEAKAYKYDRFVYDASLLPMERINAVINGKKAEAIHIFREPPLITFARGRKQITTVKRQLLASPLSKTNGNIMLEDYLLERIAHAKNGRLSQKIKYATIFEAAHITEKKQRQRAPAKVKKILDHYQTCGHIKGYTVEDDGIRLSL